MFCKIQLTLRIQNFELKQRFLVSSQSRGRMYRTNGWLHDAIFKHFELFVIHFFYNELFHIFSYEESTMHSIDNIQDEN